MKIKTAILIIIASLTITNAAARIERERAPFERPFLSEQTSFAQTSLAELPKSWLQSSNEGETEGGLRGGRGLDEVPLSSGDPGFAANPIHAAPWALILMATAYATVVNKRKNAYKQNV